MAIPLKDRFLRYVRIEAESGCWLWTGYRKNNGYGAIRVGKRLLLAHRVSYELFRGQIPSGLLVCHVCDVRLCVNPAHLFLGTPGDNIRDAVRKGKFIYRRGELIARHKLTWKKAESIRAKYETGFWTHRDLAQYYGVDHSTICRLLNYKTWVL